MLGFQRFPASCLAVAGVLLAAGGLALPVRYAYGQPQAHAFSLASTYETAHARGQLVGSAVVVMRDGALVASEGHGLADHEAEREMSPSDTAFRATSVTKALTAMAVLTLAAEGTLDLEADVARYLDFPLAGADAYARPIRLRDLLTHTAGFEERSRDFYMPPETTLEGYVRTHQPAIAWPPGRTISYSNYGYALAGRIVERATGQAFDAYLEEALFEPLGLALATVAKPHPAAATAALAREYANAGAPPEPLRYLPDAPAGGLVATPLELARLFSAALLPSEGSAPLLPAPAKRALLTQQFTLHPAIDGVTFGLRELRFRGRRVLYAGGDSCCHHTDVYVVPDLRLVFVHSYVGTDRRYRGEAWRAFADAHLSPIEDAARVQPADGAGAPQGVEGRYLLTRRPERSMFTLLYRFTNAIEVVAAADGTVTLPGVYRTPEGKPRIYAPLGGGVYEEPGDRHRIAFLADGDGDRAARFAGGGIVEAHRVTWTTDSRVLGAALGFALVVMLLTLLGALVAAFRHRTRPPPALRAQHIAIRLSALATLAFVLVFAGFAVKAQADLALLAAANDWVLRVAQALALVAVVTGIAALVLSRRAWRAAGTFDRVRLVLQSLAVIVVAALVVGHHVLAPAIAY